MQLSAKDHQRFQTSYATVLKAHMDALKKREKKDKKSASTKAPGSWAYFWRYVNQLLGQFFTLEKPFCYNRW